MCYAPLSAGAGSGPADDISESSVKPHTDPMIPNDAQAGSKYHELDSVGVNLKPCNDTLIWPISGIIRKKIPPA